MAASKPGSTIASLPFITNMETALDRAMVEGMDKSALPGPVLITSICPSATKTVSAEKLSAAASSPATPWIWPLAMVITNAPNAAKVEPSHGAWAAR